MLSQRISRIVTIYLPDTLTDLDLSGDLAAPFNNLLVFVTSTRQLVCLADIPELLRYRQTCHNLFVALISEVFDLSPQASSIFSPFSRTLPRLGTYLADSRR